MIRLEVWLDDEMVGWLSHAAASNRFAFSYTPEWKAATRSYPLSPLLPLEAPGDESAEAHSAHVRQFFENLLPEGEALDHAAQASGTSRSNLVGLIVALGKETAGALRIATEGQAAKHVDSLRPVTRLELSRRIRQRAEVPFSVWDGKVRLSIAGYQDKIAVYEKGADWFLVDGPRLASTVIVKPQPALPKMASLPGNEYMCMQLAQRVGLQVAPTRLVHLPEPVLLVTRFDRAETGSRVRRLHVIDGCQALGVSVAMKYERAYGDGRDVRDIRDGVTFAKLFRLLDLSPQPAADRQALLRWAIFQVLVGNTDAHGKNVSFFCDVQGLRLAPAYDIVCTRALGNDQLSDTFAMAVGDAFTETELSPIEWASFARQCGLPLRMVSQQLGQLALRIIDNLQGAFDDAVKAGVPEDVARAVAECVAATCWEQLEMAPRILEVRPSDF